MSIQDQAVVGLWRTRPRRMSWFVDSRPRGCDPGPFRWSARSPADSSQLEGKREPGRRFTHFSIHPAGRQQPIKDGYTFHISNTVARICSQEFRERELALNASTTDDGGRIPFISTHDSAAHRSEKSRKCCREGCGSSFPFEAPSVLSLNLL